MSNHNRGWLDLVNYLCKNLFEAEERRIKAVTVDLIQQNSEAHNTQLDAFFFRSVIYRYPGARGRPTSRSLHVSLYGTMEKCLEDMDRVQADQAEVQQMLFRLMQPCTTQQEIRDALPDCLTEMLPEWGKKLERRYEEAWSITTDPRAWEQYQKAKPKIEMYSVTRLLY